MESGPLCDVISATSFDTITVLQVETITVQRQSVHRGHQLIAQRAARTALHSSLSEPLTASHFNYRKFNHCPLSPPVPALDPITAVTLEGKGKNAGAQSVVGATLWRHCQERAGTVREDKRWRGLFSINPRLGLFNYAVKGLKMEQNIWPVSVQHLLDCRWLQMFSRAHVYILAGLNLCRQIVLVSLVRNIQNGKLFFFGFNPWKYLLWVLKFFALNELKLLWLFKNVQKHAERPK